MGTAAPYSGSVCRVTAVCEFSVRSVQFIDEYSALVHQNILCSLFITVHEDYKSHNFTPECFLDLGSCDGVNP